MHSHILLKSVHNSTNPLIHTLPRESINHHRHRHPFFSRREKDREREKKRDKDRPSGSSSGTGSGSGDRDRDRSSGKISGGKGGGSGGGSGGGGYNALLEPAPPADKDLQEALKRSLQTFREESVATHSNHPTNQGVYAYSNSLPMCYLTSTLTLYLYLYFLPLPLLMVLMHPNYS